MPASGTVLLNPQAKLHSGSRETRRIQSSESRDGLVLGADVGALFSRATSITNISIDACSSRQSPLSPTPMSGLGLPIIFMVLLFLQLLTSQG